jgi:hypothetical protein
LATGDSSLRLEWQHVSSPAAYFDKLNMTALATCLKLHLEVMRLPRRSAKSGTPRNDNFFETVYLSEKIASSDEKSDSQ